MALITGTRVGVYEVTAPIGEGGMGQVYRARDTKLHRDVAPKVLPDSFVSDPDRLARFTREAQTLAALNPGVIFPDLPIHLVLQNDRAPDTAVLRDYLTKALESAPAAWTAKRVSSSADAQKAMTGLKARVFQPDSAAHAIYKELYALYHTLHDAFGMQQSNGNLYNVMKELIQIRSQVRK